MLKQAVYFRSTFPYLVPTCLRYKKFLLQYHNFASYTINQAPQTPPPWLVHLTAVIPGWSLWPSIDPVHPAGDHNAHNWSQAQLSSLQPPLLMSCPLQSLEVARRQKKEISQAPSASKLQPGVQQASCYGVLLILLGNGLGPRHFSGTIIQIWH